MKDTFSLEFFREAGRRGGNKTKKRGRAYYQKIRKMRGKKGILKDKKA